MTASAGGEVERTVSTVISYLTGLAAEKSDQPVGQDLADLDQTFVGVHSLW
jgi:hypothetical protein